MATTYFSTGDEKMFRHHVAEHLGGQASDTFEEPGEFQATAYDGPRYPATQILHRRLPPHRRHRRRRPRVGRLRPGPADLRVPPPRGRPRRAAAGAPRHHRAASSRDHRPGRIRRAAGLPRHRDEPARRRRGHPASALGRRRRRRDHRQHRPPSEKPHDCDVATAATSWVRESTSIRRIAAETCDSTVRTDRVNWPAISAFDMPAATRVATRR